MVPSWLLLTLLTTARYLRQGMPFNLGWWGFKFPLGLYSLAVLTLGAETHLSFITTIGTALVVCLTLFWVVIATRTLNGALHRTLFVSPSLTSGNVCRDFAADAV